MAGKRRPSDLSRFVIQLLPSGVDAASFQRWEKNRSQDGETSSAFADLWFKVGLALIMPKYMLES